MKIRGLGRIQPAVRNIQNRMGATAVILLYHRVSKEVGGVQNLIVSPSHFSEQLAVLSKYTCPVSLEELPTLLKKRNRSDRPLSVVTFDDGYVDNLEQAAPLLTQHAVPATVFVTTAAMNQSYEFYWDALERLLFRSGLTGSLTLDIEGTTHTWNFPDHDLESDDWHVQMPPRTAAQQAYLELCRLIKPLHPDQRMNAMQQVFAWTGLNTSPDLAKRVMSDEELRRLTSNGLVTVGAHTVNHPVLSSMQPQEQAREINESRDQLEQILDRPIRTFSYPYGCLQHYTKDTVNLAREAGFTCACSNFPHLCNRWTDPFQLPRFITGDIDGEAFEKMLHNILISI